MIRPRGEVDRRVEVVVKGQPAVLTAVDVLLGRELRFEHPAIRASLGAGDRWVGRHQYGAVPSALVPQLAAELGEARVVHRSGQLVVAQHALDAEVFQGKRRWVLAGVVVNLWMWSRPRWATLAWRLARRRAAPLRLPEPRTLREWAREMRPSLRSPRDS